MHSVAALWSAFWKIKKDHKYDQIKRVNSAPLKLGCFHNIFSKIFTDQK